MAIDIKSLRIGSHVLVDGKRVRVDSIDTLRMKDEPIRLFVSHNGLVYGNPSIDEVEPIPITAELLAELGFRHENTSGWRKEAENKYWIFANCTEKQGWRFSLYPPRTDWARSVLYARYLHEIEGQLAYYGVELITE